MGEMDCFVSSLRVDLDTSMQGQKTSSTCISHLESTEILPEVLPKQVSNVFLGRNWRNLSLQSIRTVLRSRNMGTYNDVKPPLQCGRVVSFDWFWSQQTLEA